MSIRLSKCGVVVRRVFFADGQLVDMIVGTSLALCFEDDRTRLKSSRT